MRDETAHGVDDQAMESGLATGCRFARAWRVAHSCALVLAAALLAAGCGAAAGAAGTARDTITIGLDQEPQCLNGWIQCGSMAVTRSITDLLFDQLIEIDGAGHYAPGIALQVPTPENGLVTTRPNGGMDVTLHLDPAARWSDGVPITCRDLEFVRRTNMDERWSIISRRGWDLVRHIDCPNPHTATVRFTQPYAPYLNLLKTAPLPAHILDHADFNRAMIDRVRVVSGPYRLAGWDRSVAVRLVRNDAWWQLHRAHPARRPVKHVRFTFVADSNTLKIQLRTGEVDVINPPVDSTLQQELRRFPRVAFQSAPDIYWEQLAFNAGRGPTRDVRVRRAVAYSIDRSQIARVVLRGQVTVLDSTLLPSQGDFYVPAFRYYQASAARASRELRAAGYRQQGRWWTRDGVRLTLDFRSTAGNPLRVKMAQLIQQRLRANGIDMRIRMEPPPVLFTTTLTQGNFDVALFSWSSGLDPSQRNLLSCDQIPSRANNFQGQNNYRWCNRTVSRLLDAAEVAPEHTRRVRLTHDIQRLTAADMPVLPLFQRPATVAYATRIRGVTVSPLAGPTWNTASWSVAQ